MTWRPPSPKMGGLAEPNLGTNMADQARMTWELVKKIRSASPLVHNITNYVVMNNTANALLALGAAPAMVHAAEEVEEFVAIASSLVINIGTLSPPWITGMRLGAARARALGKPWVLDPVGVGATPLRTSVTQQLAKLGPAVIRANASETLSLASVTLKVTRGVDSTDPSQIAVEPARWVAKDHGCVVVVSGAVDYVTDGDRVCEIHNGHPMMPRVTGLGCTASALVGAFLAVEPDPFVAAAHAMAVMGVAGEIAAERSPGPGSLQMHLLDVLYQLDEAALARVRIR
ncbi:hydroxyethylthiazole kinase [Polyangium sp. 6x1]|uniref:hydroxyethylthiazole kinase n=1 Tax=Polyangium sp. 6x1 TaxID=3042689 RepID=UPI00248249A9|nr:hydroxyethylthiazole kinase [Polyangium sp. 6x1]MDI1446399.1 hydroxyethylthiazole kinase [Polyangium sp. 6x1]